MLPILMVTAVPVLICLVITFVLRPKGEVPKVPNQTFQSHIYVSSTWAPPIKEIKPYRYQTREDPLKPHPVFDELEIFMKESEARLNAAISASKILFDLGIDERKKLQLV